MSNSLNRRHFLMLSAMGAASTFWPIFPKAKADRLNLGIIGLGKQFHRRHLQWLDLANIAAICDVDQKRLEYAKAEILKRTPNASTTSLKTFTDFRKLLEDKSIDAVVIITPTHWHPYMCVAAMQAGKHVYCEKPLALSLQESRAIVAAEKKYKRVFQTGFQQRSEVRFQKIVNFVQQGRLGDLKKIRVHVGGPGVPCFLPAQNTPAGVDWEMWTGPSRPVSFHDDFMPANYLERDGNWRLYEEFGGGHLIDFGVHSFDAAQWMNESEFSGPTRIKHNSDQETVSLFYENGLEVEHTNRYDEFMMEIYGTKGSIFTNRDSTKFHPDSLEEGFWNQSLAERFGPGANFTTYYRRHLAYKAHFENWLASIRGGTQVLCPAEIGHRSVSIALLCTIAHQLKLPYSLRWNPEKEEFIEHGAANSLRQRFVIEKWKV